MRSNQGNVVSRWLKGKKKWIILPTAAVVLIVVMVFGVTEATQGKGYWKAVFSGKQDKIESHMAGFEVPH